MNATIINSVSIIVLAVAFIWHCIGSRH